MLESLVSLLPVKLQDKAKGVVAILGTLLGLVALVVDGSPEWLSKAIVVATALGVYVTPNVGYKSILGKA